MPGRLEEWRRDRQLRRLKMDDAVAITENDWAIVWRKLDIVPSMLGRVVLGEFCIGGKPVAPIIAFVGYTTRAEVIDALRRQLHLREVEAADFLDCHHDAAYVADRVEEGLALFARGPDEH
jgi:hypothetical protein